MRKLSEIAAEIKDDWKKVYFGAVPYLDAMLNLEDLNSKHGLEDGRYVVLYFLSNAGHYRGPTARKLKTELKEMLACFQNEQKTSRHRSTTQASQSTKIAPENTTTRSSSDGDQTSKRPR